MSTHQQIARLLQGLGDSYSLFTGKEESFILELATSRNGVALPLDVCLARLQKASFILPEIHRRREMVPEGNKRLLVEARKTFYSNIADSAHKLAHIARLSDWFNEAGLKVVFMKGAAELSYFKDSVEYLGRRYMSDLDALCPVDQLYEVDKLLAEHGYELFSIDAPCDDRRGIIQHCVAKHSHVVYNAFTDDHLEIHPCLAADWNSDCYPEGFSDLILNDARQIELSNSKVWIPRPEHLLVQFLCHVAAKKDHEELLYLRTVGFDQFCEDGMPPGTVPINLRLDAYQLQFLLRARWLLTELNSRFELDSNLVSSLLSRVADSKRLEMYLDLAAHFLPGLLPIERHTTFESLCEQRRQLVVEWALPAAIAQLNQILEKEIANKIELLRLSFEARMVQVENHAKQGVENSKQLEMFQQQVAENFKQLQTFQQQVAERFTNLEKRVDMSNRQQPSEPVVGKLQAAK